MQKYIRYSKVEITPVIEAILSIKSKETFDSFKVGVDSLRLQTFAKKGLTCVSCGLTASYFAVEIDHVNHMRGNTPHLNLYGIKDDKDVLFTHDHILARSLGGSNNLENTQTMCSPCNHQKSLLENAEREANPEKYDKFKKKR